MLSRSYLNVSRTVLYRPSMVIAQRSAFHTTRFTQKSATEVVKEKLDTLNKKIGQVAAEGIEKTQEATHKAGDVAQEAKEKASQKLGETEELSRSSKAELKDKAQSTMGRAEDKAEDLGKKAENVGKDVKKGAARNIEDAQDYVDKKTK
ncbi:uncharacterized protein TDEL_0C01830 [Torulaspora delbrueckii]|uniref:Uncharacterized protein n=1 Tax=Torulaspora delbrueckii TaxID=4950 RepID=G8ZRD0_TORDE|nr:hypothetical protein TDEL_0C01830 [Torulaspora delbrueckii]CCE91072.1 hypothetical protein TDEL_0C01830 [Torulaspora delbrueckii]